MALGSWVSVSNNPHHTVIPSQPQLQPTLLCVTSGDLGVNGMGIPIGKLALYCAAGGIQPDKVLPVMLDMGTNNQVPALLYMMNPTRTRASDPNFWCCYQDLLRDPHYLGTPSKRLEGHEYFSLVDEFMAAAHYRWPDAVIQFEDFSSDKVISLISKSNPMLPNPKLARSSLLSQSLTLCYLTLS